MHLGDPDRVPDLGLAQVEEVAKRHNAALARIEPARRGRDERAVEPDVVELRRRRRSGVLGLAVERFGRAERRHQRGVALKVPRYTQRVAAIAKMPADLALHAHRGIGRELALPPALATVDSRDQGHVPDLDEIVEWLAATREAARDRAYERKVSLDHAITCMRRVTGRRRLRDSHVFNARSFRR